MNGFEVRPVPRAGLIGRLLGRRNKEHAFLEVKNLLARTPIPDVSPGSIEAILATYRLKPASARAGLCAVYGTVLEYFVRDLELSDAEVSALRRLRDLFGLRQRDIAEIEASVLAGIYRREFQTALADKRLTPEEKERLDTIVRQLRIPREVYEPIFKEDGTAVVLRVFNEACADRRLSPDEEQQLAALAKDLGATLKQDDATLAALERFRLLWRLEQGGALPSIPVPIRLQREECCHVSVPASHHEFRTVTRAFRYSGPTARIKIAKGISWRLGQINLERVTDEVLTQLDSGTLYVTNKRLLFDGTRKTAQIPFKKVMRFTPYQNGIRVEKDSGKDQFFACTTDIEVLSVILDSALAASTE